MVVRKVRLNGILCGSLARIIIFVFIIFTFIYFYGNLVLRNGQITGSVVDFGNLVVQLDFIIMCMYSMMLNINNQLSNMYS